MSQIFIGVAFHSARAIRRQARHLAASWRARQKMP
jgi:hypothetical protein